MSDIACLRRLAATQCALPSRTRVYAYAIPNHYAETPIVDVVICAPDLPLSHGAWPLLDAVADTWADCPHTTIAATHGEDDEIRRVTVTYWSTIP